MNRLSRGIARWTNSQIDSMGGTANAKPFSLDRNDGVVGLKLDLLDEVLPAESVIVYGDMHIVEGAYSEYCIQSGNAVLLIDSFETPGWQQRRLEHPNLDFRKGDFSDPFFMQSVRETFEVGVAYEVLLHQATLLHALHMMLERVTGKLVLAQPMLHELDAPNSLVYLPGMPSPEFYPLSDRDPGYKMFDPEVVKQGNWIWGMTPSFLRAALEGEGFIVTAERVLGDLPNPKWMNWGCIAERKRTRFTEHWSNFRSAPGLIDPVGNSLCDQ